MGPGAAAIMQTGGGDRGYFRTSRTVRHLRPLFPAGLKLPAAVPDFGLAARFDLPASSLRVQPTSERRPSRRRSGGRPLAAWAQAGVSHVQ